MKHNWYISQLGSTLHIRTRLIRTFLLDAFTTSSGKNLEPDKHQSQTQRSDLFSYGQNKDYGNSAIFHIEIKRKDEVLHRMVKMLILICRRFVLVFFLLFCLFAVLAS